MKIDVTYEKKDILRLLEKDLLDKGIRVKEGTALVYKGALEVRLAVETDDAAPPPPPRSVAVPDSTVDVVVVDEPADDGDMSSILVASGRLVRAPGGKVRPLGLNESIEFPK